MTSYCPNVIPNELKKHWLTGPTQVCFREVKQVSGKWVCPKCGVLK